MSQNQNYALFVKKTCSSVRSYPTRTVRDLDILSRKTYLTIQSRQFECKDCKRYFIEDLELVQGNHGLTKRYESYLYGMIFIEKGGAFCNQIESVISDMWDGYVNLAGEKGVFKNAINVIDLFHFVQHLGAALDGEHKVARKEFPESECLKSLRWTVLKSRRVLTECGDVP